MGARPPRPRAASRGGDVEAAVRSYDRALQRPPRLSISRSPGSRAPAPPRVDSATRSRCVRSARPRACRRLDARRGAGRRCTLAAGDAVRRRRALGTRSRRHGARRRGDGRHERPRAGAVPRGSRSPTRRRRSASPAPRSRGATTSTTDDVLAWSLLQDRSAARRRSAASHRALRLGTQDATPPLSRRHDRRRPRTPAPAGAPPRARACDRPGTSTYTRPWRAPRSRAGTGARAGDDAHGCSTASCCSCPRLAARASARQLHHQSLRRASRSSPTPSSCATSSTWPSCRRIAALRRADATATATLDAGGARRVRARATAADDRARPRARRRRRAPCALAVRRDRPRARRRAPAACATLRVEVALRRAAPGARRRSSPSATRTSPGAPGWQRDRRAARTAASRSADATVPATDASRVLRAYPDDLLQAPLAGQRGAHALRPRARSRRPPSAPSPAGARSGAKRFGDRLTALLADPRPLSAGHADVAAGGRCSAPCTRSRPGHGKTIVGAYLVGSRGTVRDAIVLGLVVTATHTIGVYVLGLRRRSPRRHWVVPERLFPWISALSGAIVVGRRRVALTPLADARRASPATTEHQHARRPSSPRSRSSARREPRPRAPAAARRAGHAAAPRRPRRLGRSPAVPVRARRDAGRRGARTRGVRPRC